ncbi:hypothetical protein P3X46_022087 [Hevea brasiliensis]|uniref:Protein kinase domain-containing protein n=1 Tax=Hevea brasiliensis TaxID=3981 RepID=A0ABQ9LIT2_HEVBR|nr:hypothetical protein P3X46_022087 [Hevea brasiliensis]
MVSSTPGMILSISATGLESLLVAAIKRVTSLVLEGQNLTFAIGVNNFSGPIPNSLSNASQLQIVDISSNDFPIFSTKLSYLYLGENEITGIIPAALDNLINLIGLCMEDNYFTGEIPGTIGDCLSLEYLYMQGNFFQGTIPSSLASLKGLRYLDLSRNNLNPLSPILESFFQGEVPKRGVFANVSALSLFGNSKLCSGITKLGLPKCPTRILKKVKSHTLKLLVVIACVVPLLLILIFFLIRWMRKLRCRPSFAPLEMNHLLKVSYKDFYQSTDGFSSSNLIGSGAFGSVYKGFLPQVKRLVAVKVLSLKRTGSIKSFMAECNSLGIIRHQNLVKLVTCCSSLGYKSNAFKALIFEYMGSGSLEKWLHPCEGGENQKRSLNLLQRLNIAIDVASALHYLHDLWKAYHSL